MKLLHGDHKQGQKELFVWYSIRPGRKSETKPLKFDLFNLTYSRPGVVF